MWYDLWAPRTIPLVLFKLRPQAYSNAPPRCRFVNSRVSVRQPSRGFSELSRSVRSLPPKPGARRPEQNLQPTGTPIRKLLRRPRRIQAGKRRRSQRPPPQPRRHPELRIRNRRSPMWPLPPRETALERPPGRSRTPICPRFLNAHRGWTATCRWSEQPAHVRTSCGLLSRQPSLSRRHLVRAADSLSRTPAS